MRALAPQRSRSHHERCNVTKWTDQSGQENHAIVSTFGAPSYTPTGGLNGYGYFSGAAGKGFTGSLVVAVEANPWEVMGVASFTGGTGGMFDGTGDGAGYPAVVTVGNNLEQHLQSSTVNPVALGSSNTGFAFDCFFSTTGAFAYANGNTNGATSSTGSIIPGEGASYFLLNTAAGNPWNGNLYEIVVFNQSLGTNGRNAMKSYFSQRYGITA